jgi:hypothetical protein
MIIRTRGTPQTLGLLSFAAGYVDGSFRTPSSMVLQARRGVRSTALTAAWWRPPAGWRVRWQSAWWAELSE